MAHEISIRSNGVIEAIFGENMAPWWQKTTMQAKVVQGFLSFDDIFSREDSPFNWTAIVEQLQYADGGLSSQHGIRRSDTLAELGVHSGQYGNIQPKDMFNFCAAFFDAHPEIPISSAIVMQGGAVLSISAKVGEIDILGSGDKSSSYLSFTNSYNGRIKAQASKSYIRHVCMNTTISSISSADINFVYKHTKNVQERMKGDQKKIHGLMVAQIATDEKIQEVLETLAKRKLVGKDGAQRCDKILTELFGESTATRSKNIRADVLELFADNDGEKFPEWKNTPYSLYQSITNYVDHKRGTRDTTGIGESASRFESATIGAGAQLKCRALELVLAHSEGCEESTPKYFMASSPTDVATGYASNPDTTPHTDYSVLAEEYDPSYDDQPPTDISTISTEEVETVDIYTTAPLHIDHHISVQLGAIIEILSPTVSMYRLIVSANDAEYYIDTAKQEGYAAFTEAEWTALHSN